MPRCYILKKHANQSKSTLKDKPVLGDGNNSCWQPTKTSKQNANIALKRHDTPISPTEAYTSIYYNHTLENQSGKCFSNFMSFACTILCDIYDAAAHPPSLRALCQRDLDMKGT